MTRRLSTRLGAEPSGAILEHLHAARTQVLDLLRGYAIEPKHLIPISASGIRSSPAVRLASSRVTRCYTCMKKSPRPFTFEVKRSRLASRTPPTFQRYVVAPVSTEVQREQEALGHKSVRASDHPPLRSDGRILPSLLGEKVWVEQPVRLAPAPPEPVEACETLDEPAIEPSPIESAMVERPANQADEEPSRPKRARRLAKTPDDLPRGERWKRRLPRVAW
jgi:hypothetical protein